MIEIALVADNISVENGLSFILEHLALSYNIKIVSPEDIGKEHIQLIITNIPEALSFGKAKSFFISTENNLNVLKANRRRLSYNLNRADQVFVLSRVAKDFFDSISIKSSIQYPFIPINNFSEKKNIYYRHLPAEIVKSLKDLDVRELKNASDLKDAKLLIYRPQFNEAFNILVPLSGSYGVPCIVEDTGCIREFINSGDTLISKSSPVKQWVDAVKIANRDLSIRSEKTKNVNLRFNNASELIFKIQKALNIVTAPRPVPKMVKETVKNGVMTVKQKTIVKRISGHRKKEDPVGKVQKVKIKRNPIVIPSWFLNKEPVDVSIIVPMYKSAEVIQEQIKSWDLNDRIKKEIIYVDDACPDDSSLTVIESWELRKDQLTSPVGNILELEKNFGFAAACNAGAKIAKGKYLIFLNADCIVTPNWVAPMIELLGDETIGIVGNMQLRSGNSIESAGSQWSWESGFFEHIGKTIYKHKRINPPFRLEHAPNDLMISQKREMVTGCCFAIPKHVYDEVNGFDENYKIGYWEDSDLNMRVQQKGYQVYFQPKSKIFHKVGHSGAGGHAFLAENKKLFYKKWVHNGVIDLFVSPKEKQKIEVEKEKIVVYTAITNKYDALKDGQNTCGVDFVSFLEEGAYCGNWKYLPVCKEYSDPNRNAKIHKVLPHRFFPDKEYSLWIDGSITLLMPIQKIIETHMADVDILIFKHPERTCIYQEAETCLNYRLDVPDLITKQVARYRRDGFPENFGLVEATVILRRHTKTMNEFNERWWHEIENGSKRDQLSFNYVAWKTGLKIGYFPGFLREKSPQKSGFFKRSEHSKRR